MQSVFPQALKAKDMIQESILLTTGLSWEEYNCSLQLPSVLRLLHKLGPEHAVDWFDSPDKLSQIGFDGNRPRDSTRCSWMHIILYVS